MDILDSIKDKELHKYIVSIESPEIGVYKVVLGNLLTPIQVTAMVNKLSKLNFPILQVEYRGVYFQVKKHKVSLFIDCGRKIKVNTIGEISSYLYSKGV